MSRNLIDLQGRVARSELVHDRRVWLTYALVFALVGSCAAGTSLLWPSIWPPARVLPFAGLLFVIAASAALTDPPRMHQLRNHVVLATIPVSTALGMAVFAPHGTVPLAAAVFMATFTSARLQSRRLLAAHFVGGAAVLCAPLLLLDLDAHTALALAATIPSILLVGATAVAILEAVEAQSDELEWLVRADPLTGVGNRRRLTEAMLHELPRHARAGRSFTVLAMDLDGFKAINDQLGHDAGDELLRQVARGLQLAVREQDTVVRQGGDEFCLLLPETGPEEVGAVQRAIERTLAGIAVEGLSVSTSFGHASFPADGDDEHTLLRRADARLAAHKSTSRSDVVAAEGDGHDVDPNAFAAHTVSAARISRSEFAVSRTVWRVASGMVALYGFAALLMAAWAPLGPAQGMLVVGLLLLLAAVTVAATSPPHPGHWRNQLVVAIPYLGSGLTILLAPDYAAAATGSLALCGAVIAVRLVDHRQIVAHVLLATAVIGAAGLSGWLPVDVGLGLLLALVVVWATAFGATVYFEAAEAQGRELERIVRRDPLTGLGNRRALDEALQSELRRHRRSGRPLTVATLDLNGFKALNDDLGHEAGDEALCAVAGALRALLRESDTVVRQGGDEFCLLLPETGEQQAAQLATAIRRAVATAGSAEHPLSTALGIAVFPDDGQDAPVLLAVADAALRQEKQRRPREQQRRFDRPARMLRPAAE